MLDLVLSDFARWLQTQSVRARPASHLEKAHATSIFDANPIYLSRVRLRKLRFARDYSGSVFSKYFAREF